MNREDIIRMAREAGLTVCRDEWVFGEILERFATLVAAYVRETEFKPDWNNYRQGVADGAAEEREACAKVCEEHWEIDGTHTAKEFASYIRARGRA